MPQAFSLVNLCHSLLALSQWVNATKVVERTFPTAGNSPQSRIGKALFDEPPQSHQHPTRHSIRQMGSNSSKPAASHAQSAQQADLDRCLARAKGASSVVSLPNLSPEESPFQVPTKLPERPGKRLRLFTRKSKPKGAEVTTLSPAEIMAAIRSPQRQLPSLSISDDETPIIFPFVGAKRKPLPTAHAARQDPKPVLRVMNPDIAPALTEHGAQSSTLNSNNHSNDRSIFSDSGRRSLSPEQEMMIPARLPFKKPLCIPEDSDEDEGVSTHYKPSPGRVDRKRTRLIDMFDDGDTHMSDFHRVPNMLNDLEQKIQGASEAMQWSGERLTAGAQRNAYRILFSELPDFLPIEPGVWPRDPTNSPPQKARIRECASSPLLRYRHAPTPDDKHTRNPAHSPERPLPDPLVKRFARLRKAQPNATEASSHEDLPLPSIETHGTAYQQDYEHLLSSNNPFLDRGMARAPRRSARLSKGPSEPYPSTETREHRKEEASNGYVRYPDLSSASAEALDRTTLSPTPTPAQSSLNQIDELVQEFDCELSALQQRRAKHEAWRNILSESETLHPTPSRPKADPQSQRGTRNSPILLSDDEEELDPKVRFPSIPEGPDRNNRTEADFDNFIHDIRNRFTPSEAESRWSEPYSVDRASQEATDAAFARQCQKEEDERLESDDSFSSIDIEWECVSCNEVFSVDAFPSLMQCTHQADTCADCYKGWLAAQIQEKARGQISCPSFECNVLLQHHEIQQHASEEDYQK